MSIAQEILSSMYEINMDFHDENPALAVAVVRTLTEHLLPVQPPEGLTASRTECLAGVVRAAIRSKCLDVLAELRQEGQG
jgi:hypothetical protein